MRKDAATALRNGAQIGPTEPSASQSKPLLLHFCRQAVFLLVTVPGFTLLIGCNPGARKTIQSEATLDPCAALLERDPHCGWKPHWDDTGAITNALDGTKREFLSLESTDADGVDYDRLHYATLRLCFQDGKPCGGESVTVGFRVHGMVRSLDDDNQYWTAVRFRFDKEQLIKEHWTIADSREAFGPPSGKKVHLFLSQLLQHEKLILEFSYDEHSPRTLTFDLPGLAERMKSANLSL
jgi:hypothetical protein